MLSSWWRGQDLNLRPSGYECTDARGWWSALGVSSAATTSVVCVGGIPLVLVVLYDCCTRQVMTRFAIGASLARVGER